MLSKYRLYDIYDGVERLGGFDTMQEVRRAAAKRDEETDGECYLVVGRFVKRTGSYKILENWRY